MPVCHGACVTASCFVSHGEFVGKGFVLLVTAGDKQWDIDIPRGEVSVFTLPGFDFWLS